MSLIRSSIFSMPAKLLDIRVYLDFDGTLTSVDGQATVSSALYKTLHSGGKNYASSTFDPHEILIDKLKTGLEEPANQIIVMQAKATIFVKKMMALGANISIISKNRAEYIKALLEIAGFSHKEIASIAIYDIIELSKPTINGKRGMIAALESKNSSMAEMSAADEGEIILSVKKADIYVICDDAAADRKEMLAGLVLPFDPVQEESVAEDICILAPIVRSAGTFDFVEITKQLEEKLQCGLKTPSP